LAVLASLAREQEAELARRVYALYGLTYGEVKIIEPEFGMRAEAYHRLTV
jgi:hypothetical protein